MHSPKHASAAASPAKDLSSTFIGATDEVVWKQNSLSSLSSLVALIFLVSFAGSSQTLRRSHPWCYNSRHRELLPCSNPFSTIQPLTAKITSLDQSSDGVMVVFSCTYMSAFDTRCCNAPSTTLLCLRLARNKLANPTHHPPPCQKVEKKEGWLPPISRLPFISSCSW